MKQSKGKETKRKGFALIVGLIALASAVVMSLCLSMPFVRKQSALGSVGERTLLELTPFATAVAYYSSGEISEWVTQGTAAPNGSVKGLLEQVEAQQDYEALTLIYRDAKKATKNLFDGSEFSLAVYKPAKSILDKIYTGKSVGAYATDLVTRADMQQVATVYLPIYGQGRTVLAVLVAECDPGNTSYHLVGPVNLYYMGGTAALVLLCCVVLLYVRYRLHGAKQQGEGAAKEKKSDEPASPQDEPIEAPIAESELFPEDDFQLSMAATSPEQETKERV